MPTTESKLLDQQAVEELEARLLKEVGHVTLPVVLVSALCHTVKHLRAENEKLKAERDKWKRKYRSIDIND